MSPLVTRLTTPIDTLDLTVLAECEATGHPHNPRSAADSRQTLSILARLELAGLLTTAMFFGDPNVVTEAGRAALAARVKT